MSIFLQALGFQEGSDPFKPRNSRGFTLVELLVVIAIISVLATLLLLQLGVARSKARDAKRIADINQVRSAMELYFDDNGRYPATMNLGAAGAQLAPLYLTNIPMDPIATCTASTYDGAVSGVFNCYGYEWRPAANPSSAHLWAELERFNTNALNNDADINSTGWGGSGAEANGATDTAATCTGAAPNNCIYDSGQQ